jgi:hypothetical protein
MPSRDLEFQAKRLDQPQDGTLIFTANEVLFRPAQDRYPEAHIASHEIIDFSVDTTDTREKKVDPISVYFFGLWAFLFPKKSGNLTIKITVKTSQSRMQFLVDEKAINAIRSHISYSPS